MSWNIWAWSCSFFSTLGVVWQAALTNTKVILNLLTDIDILLIVGKGIRGGIFIDTWKLIQNEKKVIKKELLYLKYWDVINLYR